ncbi:MAG: hypothetical protein A2Y10_16440 [Planctomycetes bacterium GWF2_41_51]|nr:MAG: hypothetical protein A2Y10_16440 [Planctomycetes bacterium GWF2_41_51]
MMSDYENKIGHRHWRVTGFGADVIETFAILEFPHGKMVDKDGTQWLEEIYLKDWNDVQYIPLPDASDEKVYELIRQDIKEFPDTAVILDMPTAWGYIANMRSYEHIYMDMLDHRDEFKILCRRISDVLNKTVEIACKSGITALYLMEDLATTKGLSMSPAMIKEFCLDFAKEQADIAKSFGKPVLFHCCGKAIDLIPHLEYVGVDAINPLQPHLNDLAEFKSKFGKRFALYGGLDNSFTIAKGTPQKVREHVLDVFEKVGDCDGALVFSSHDISVDTPAENIDMMIKTMQQECFY